MNVPQMLKWALTAMGVVAILVCHEPAQSVAATTNADAVTVALLVDPKPENDSIAWRSLRALAADVYASLGPDDRLVVFTASSRDQGPHLAITRGSDANPRGAFESAWSARVDPKAGRRRDFDQGMRAVQVEIAEALRRGDKEALVIMFGDIDRDDARAIVTQASSIAKRCPVVVVGPADAPMLVPAAATKGSLQCDILGRADPRTWNLRPTPPATVIPVVAQTADKRATDSPQAGNVAGPAHRASTDNGLVFVERELADKRRQLADLQEKIRAAHGEDVAVTEQISQGKNALANLNALRARTLSIIAELQSSVGNTRAEQQRIEDQTLAQRAVLLSVEQRIAAQADLQRQSRPTEPSAENRGSQPTTTIARQQAISAQPLAPQTPATQSANAGATAANEPQRLRPPGALSPDRAGPPTPPCIAGQTHRIQLERFGTGVFAIAALALLGWGVLVWGRAGTSIAISLVRITGVDGASSEPHKAVIARGEVLAIDTSQPEAIPSHVVDDTKVTLALGFGGRLMLHRGNREVQANHNPIADRREVHVAIGDEISIEQPEQSPLSWVIRDVRRVRDTECDESDCDIAQRE